MCEAPLAQGYPGFPAAPIVGSGRPLVAMSFFLFSFWTPLSAAPWCPGGEGWAARDGVGEGTR